MARHRRDFLKASAAGLAAASAGGLASAPAAAAPAPGAHPFEMPRNMTLLNMRVGNGYGLGVKTGRGILNVSAAAQALNMPAPTDMDDLLQNGRGGLLANLVRAAANGPASLYMREETVAHAPIVTRPEKIIMMGFNYRKHAEETNTTPPKDPPLFNKYNNTLNHHGGTIKLPTAVAKNFDYEVELVIVFGRECKNVSEAD
ncbi:MAG: fumarylacetoacetate hydrolase family protein, partial [Hyphomicrobium sp.]|nr:fumarylacetoacetate hydrolase family protein [Hyphomicrobium sp.]